MHTARPVDVAFQTGGGLWFIVSVLERCRALQHGAIIHGSVIALDDKRHLPCDDPGSLANTYLLMHAMSLSVSFDIISNDAR